MAINRYVKVLKTSSSGMMAGRCMFYLNFVWFSGAAYNIWQVKSLMLFGKYINTHEIALYTYFCDNNNHMSQFIQKSVQENVLGHIMLMVLYMHFFSFSAWHYT